jgi:very-short-patch-repair endonuclease
VNHERARNLRRNQTDVERKLWYVLRSRQLGGFKFRRQQPVGPYIADFVCFERGVIVELDGSQHGSEIGIAYDAKRSAFLESQGFRVVRFWNHEINANVDGVTEAISRALVATPHPR